MAGPLSGTAAPAPPAPAGNGAAPAPAATGSARRCCLRMTKRLGACSTSITYSMPGGKDLRAGGAREGVREGGGVGGKEGGRIRSYRR